MKKCPKHCDVVKLIHGTSLKRAENIMKNGFYEITDEKFSDLEKGKIGCDMRENQGGIGEVGVHYFFRQGINDPRYMALAMYSHGNRVAKKDNSTPAVITFDACLCNHITTKQSQDQGWIDELSNFAKNTYDKEDTRWYRDLRSTNNPIDLFQDLATKKVTIGRLMSDLNIDAIDEWDDVVVLKNPNKNIIEGTMRIIKKDDVGNKR
jgi:hypothetical protein